MAGQGVSVGKGFVTIYPYLTMKGFDRQLKQGVKAPIVKTSSEAGKEGGKEVGKGIGDGVEPATKNATASFKDMALNIGKIFAGLKLGQYAYDFVKGSVEAFGEFEQLEGGIKTLFKIGDGEDLSAYNEVMKNASQAYRTAGISANQYMNTTIGMSKKMLAGVGGDAMKAAQMSDMAILDMADNVNKLGSDMEGVQRAYAGFAKGNFTMLDNLNLGFDGTREGMQKLLDTAEGFTGKKYDINNLADITEAIHAIQYEWDITGTTVAEAEDTIQGSFNMMKASFEDFRVALGSGDFSQISNQFTILANNALLVLKNLIPVIINIIVGAIATLPGLIANVFSALPEMIKSVFSTLGQALGIDVTPLLTAMDSIYATVQSLLAFLQGAFAPVLESLGGVLTSALGLITDSLAVVFNLFNVLFQGIGALFTGDTAGLMAALDTLWASVSGLITGHFAELFTMVGSLISNIGNLAVTLVTGIFGGIANIFNSLGLTGLGTFFTGVTTMITGLLQGVFGVVSGLFKVFGALFTGDWQGLGDALLSIATSMWDMITAVFTGAFQILQGIFTAAIHVFVAIWEGLKAGVMIIVNALCQLMSSAFKGLVVLVTTPFNLMKTGALAIMNGFKTALHAVVQGIKNVFNFSWSIPKPKLPHFSVSGGESPWGFMGKGSLPHVSVDWYAKGGLFDAPSIIGVGEAGREAVLPIDKIKPYFHEAAQDMPANDSGELVVRWLEANLGATINRYAPTATPREFNRMVRQAI